MTYRIPVWVLIGISLLAAGRANAGLSLTLTPRIATTASTDVIDPTLPETTAWRVEFQMHDWTPTTENTNGAWVFYLGGTGVSASILNSNTLRILDQRDSITGSVCDLSLEGRRNVLGRIQRDPVAMKFYCEIWNSDGTGHALNSMPIAAFTHNFAGVGGFLGSPLTTVSLAFLKVFSTLVPAGGRPPTTATVGNMLNLRFDGDMRDTSGNNRNVRLPSALFVTTPPQLPISLPKTAGAPAWSNWVSVRAGFPATLDATSSFSLADASDQVTYRWQQLSGPTTLRWTNRSAANPEIRGMIFGTYKVRLQVADAAGATSSTDLEFGAVATDDNGVVVQANPAADTLFGPMIAFGRNPWPWADEMTLRSATVRKPYIDSISPPGWSADQPGHIDYYPSTAHQPAETTLAQDLAAAGNTIRLTDASKLDLTSLPTVVLIHPINGWYPVEEVRICGAAGNLLTVCYDGRGWLQGTYQHADTAVAWPAGAYVMQIRSVGTGTSFLSTFCPAGPGEEGQIVETAGTVAMTPGSSTITGSGTSWTNALAGQRIRIQGTHGGQPFFFYAGVKTVGGAGSITLSRQWPADADGAAGLTYAVIRPGRFMARSWTRPDGTTGRQNTNVSSCESDTRIFHYEQFSLITGYQRNASYGFSDTSWFSEYGPNYYDEVLAHYAGYLRSGYSLFLNNARKVGEYLATSPEFDEGWLSQQNRRVGATGMAAAAILDGRTSNWYTLRKLAQAAIDGPYVGAVRPDCNADLRETAYALSWLSIAALFDPVDTGNPNQPGQRSYWKSQLAAAYARDVRCKGTRGQFSSTYLNLAVGPMTMVKGSRTVKGTQIPQTLCNAVATGTINLTTGSNAATGAGFVAGAKIAVSGKRNGQPYMFFSEFAATSPSSLTLASPWDGDSGSYAFQIESDTNWLSFGADASDKANADRLYTCQWVDSSTITLDRDWMGESGTYSGGRGNLIGYGTQPFMLGIKTFAMGLAAKTGGPAGDGYAALLRDSLAWLFDTGFDPLTGGMHYGRDYSGCEPKLNPRLNCSFGLSVDEKQQSRMLNAEVQNAMRMAYEANPTAQTRELGDQFYGSQWGKKGGPYVDDVYLGLLDTDSVWNRKWLGFLFGMGMAHQWPATRLGGVRPEAPVLGSVAYNSAGVPGTVSARVVVTRPSGQENTYACTSSPCAVTLDGRQGDHWYRIVYLDAAGKLLRSSEPDILSVR